MIIKGCKQIPVSIFTNAAELPAAWNEMLPPEHPLLSKALALYESIQLPDITHYYALCGAPDRPTAIAYFQMLKVKPKHLNAGLLQGYQSALVPALLRVVRPSLLIAGHLFRHDVETFYSSASLSNLESFRSYEALIHAVAKKSCAMATLVKDVPERLVQYFQNFAPAYTLLRNDISMQMKLSCGWTSFADYEAALKHKYAQKLRKVRSGLNNLRIEELSTEQVFLNAATLYKLYEQVSRKQVFSMGMLNQQFLPLLKQFYGAELKIWAFYEGENMVAFASAWLHEDAFDMFYIGFDYERNTALNLYFNILYFSIEQAIIAQKSLLVLGRTALEAKARLGCTPHYLHTFLHVRSPYLRNLVAAKMNNQHQQEGAWEERHPMKTN